MNFSQRFCTHSVLGIGLLAMGVGTTAVAQDATGSFLEEIVVTAQKRAEALQDIGVTVNAYNRDAIREMGITDTSDVAQLTPNTTIVPTQGGLMPVITVRGIGTSSNDILFITAPPSAALHIDDVYFGAPALLLFSQFDLERAEILAGPQGTLYGRNTTAGAINFISAKPDDTFGTGISFKHGSYRTDGAYSEATGHVTGPLGGNLNGRLAFFQKSGDSYIEDLDGNAYKGPDTLALRALFDWTPSNDVSVLLNLHGGKDESGPYIFEGFAVRDAPGGNCLFEETGNQDLVNCVDIPAPDTIVSADGTQAIPFVEDPFGLNNDVFRNAGNNLNNNDIDNIGGSIKIEWNRLGGSDALSLTSITAYEDADILRNIDFGGRAIPRWFEGFQRDQLTQFSEELRLSGMHERLYWVLGGFYFTEEIEHSRGTHFNGPQSLPEQYLNQMDATQDTDAYAVFGQVEYDVSDALTLIGGLRYSFEEKSYERLVSYSFERVPGIDVLDPDFVGRTNPITGLPHLRYVRQEECPCTEDWNDLSWKAGLNYQLSDEVLLYGQASTGWKAGQFSGSSLILPAFLAQPADEETVLAFEAGFKSTWNRFRLNVAAYHMTYDNLQITATVQAPIGGFTSILDNAQEMEITGIDLDAAWAPTEAFDLTFALAWVDGEYTEFVSTDTFSGTVTDFSGEDIINVPDLSLAARARYERAVATGSIIASAELIHNTETDLEFRDNVALFGDFNRRAFVRDDHTLLNARLAWRNDANGVEVALWGENLTDETVLGNMSITRAGIRGEYFAPRTVGFSVSWDYQ